MQEMEQFKDFEYGSLNLYPDKSDREGMDVEIYMDACLHHYPLRDYKGIWNGMNTIVKITKNWVSEIRRKMTCILISTHNI